MGRARTGALAAGLGLLAAVAVGSVAQLPASGDTSPALTAGRTPPPTDPAVAVPAGNRLVADLAASGVQVYTCGATGWTLLEPAATLSHRGRTVALHSRGPVWVSTVDGSAVNAAAVPGASHPVPDAVPELLLQATATRGRGMFTGVSYIQRLNTTGGVAPARTCTAGEQVGVRYTAEYRFWVPSV